MALQNFGEKFDLQKLFRARDVARDLTYELSSLITPGMTEDEAHVLYKELSHKHGVEKQWHLPKLRFGPNTLKNFRDPSDPYILQEEDIFFLDIGPVIYGHEADYGETFNLGSSHELKYLANASKKIFYEVQVFWKERRLTGAPLYEFARSKAEALGLYLNMGSDGHRIGDFPHHIHFRGGLVECEEDVVPNAWILEIHLWDQERKIGSFFEDILTDQEI